MKYVRQFYLSKYYLILLFVISILSWNFYYPVEGVIIIIALTSVGLLSNANIVIALPGVIFLPFISREYVSLEEVPIYYFIICTILLISVIVYSIRNKFSFKRSSLKFGFLLLAICSVVSLINLQVGEEPMRYVYSISNVLVFVFYLIISGTLKGDHSDYFMFLLMLLGINLSTQLIIEGIKLGGFEQKIVSLGWGGANTCAIYINMAIIASSYLVSKSKKLLEIFLYSAITIFMAFIIVISLCRAGYLAISICAPFMIIGIFLYTKAKFKFIFVSIVLGIITASIIYLQFDVLKTIVGPAFEKSGNLSGRDKLWQFGLTEFKRHFLIGNGLFGSNVIDPVDINRLMPLHNTIIQTLYSFGILGIISLSIHYAQKFNVILRNFNVKKYFFLIITISGFVHGMLDNTYYMIAYMLVIVSLMMVIEMSDYIDDELIKTPLFKDKEETIKNVNSNENNNKKKVTYTLKY